MYKRLKLIGLALRAAGTKFFSTLSNPQRWFVEMWGGEESKAGTRVDEDTAVQVTAVFACVRLLAQTLASLPLHTYKRLPNGGKEKAWDHPLYSILHDLPNPECTSYNFRVILMVNLLLTGRAHAEIVRDQAGKVKELWPIPSNRVVTKRNEITNEIFYEVYLDNGKTQILYPEQMLHIPWMGLANFQSYKPIQLAREAIGLSIATEEFGSRFFAHGANASGIAEYPHALSDKAFDNFKSDFNKKYSGLGNAQRVLFLEEGLKFHKLTINPNEAQAIETRKFQVIEICRFYGVPPHLIMDLERATFSNVEHQDISFVKYSLRPYLVCLEQEFLRSLFLPSERGKYFSEFAVDGLLRGDYKSRQEGLEIQLRSGVINADEWRAIENMNPQPDGLGQMYHVPLNWVEKGKEEPEEPPPKGNDNNNDDDDDDDNTKSNNSNNRQKPTQLETRQKQSALLKLRIAKSYQRVFEDAARRVVVREKQDILRKARKTLTERSADDFLAWLQEFYLQAPVWMKRIIMPTLLSYAEAIQAAAADEVGAEVGMTEELEQYMDGYADIWARDYIQSSQGQLEAVLRDTYEQGLDPYEAIEARLTEWEERRPAKVAKKETIEAANVVSKFVFVAAGIRFLKWVNTSGDSCPYCKELHGRRVGIDQAFVGKNDVLSSEDGNMKIRKPALTPPLHSGCQCQIVPD